MPAGAHFGIDQFGDTILFSTDPDATIFRIPASGGTAIPVIQAGSSPREAHHWPKFLPGGKQFLYYASKLNPLENAIAVATIGEGAQRELIRSASSGQYAAAGSQDGAGTGYLLFLRDRTVMAQAFDLRKLSASGPGLPVVQGVEPGRYGAVPFSVSNNGVLVYRTEEEPRAQLA